MEVKVVIAVEVVVDTFVEVDGVSEMILEVVDVLVSFEWFSVHPTLSIRPAKRANEKRIF